MADTQTERLKTQLKILGMKTVLEIFESEAENASKTKMGYIGYLSNLIEQEFLAKTDRSITERYKQLNFHH